MSDNIFSKQPLPSGKGKEITPLVIADIQARTEVGFKKYGERLKAFNGRNALVDAYEEVLDLAQYIRQVLEEWPEIHMRTEYLLDTYNLWSEDGTFTFPDGETWHKESKE